MSRMLACHISQDNVKVNISLAPVKLFPKLSNVPSTVQSCRNTLVFQSKMMIAYMIKHMLSMIISKFCDRPLYQRMLS